MNRNRPLYSNRQGYDFTSFFNFATDIKMSSKQLEIYLILKKTIKILKGRTENLESKLYSRI